MGHTYMTSHTLDGLLVCDVIGWYDICVVLPTDAFVLPTINLHDLLSLYSRWVSTGDKSTQEIIIRGSASTFHELAPSCSVLCMTICRPQAKIECSIPQELLPSVLRHCWLGDRKGIRPVKKLDVGLLVVGMHRIAICIILQEPEPEPDIWKLVAQQLIFVFTVCYD